MHSYGFELRQSIDKKTLCLNHRDAKFRKNYLARQLVRGASLKPSSEINSASRLDPLHRGVIATDDLDSLGAS